MRKELLVFFFIVISVVAYGQSCTQRLVQAERDYEAGRLANIPTLIGDCFGKDKGTNFSKEERIRAYRLLTLVYIFIDDEPDAELSLINLLKADPEHLLDESTDPAELFFLYRQFQVGPIFRIGIRGGVNLSLPNVAQTFTTSNSGVANKFYNGDEGDGDITDLSGSQFPIGFWGEVTYEKHLGLGFEIVGGVQARFSRYDVDNFFNDATTFNNNISNNQFYGRLPVYARYTYNYRRRTGPKPYVFLGGSADYLVSATYTNASRRGGTPFTLTTGAGSGDDLKEFDQVNEWNFSLTGGVGVKLPVKTHFFTLELRYDNSLLNYIKSENRYANQKVAFDLGHVEDNLTLNYLSFSIGYIRSIYHPKRNDKK